jgi:hypothetical protein
LVLKCFLFFCGEGKGREGKGREGKGREGKGREGKEGIEFRYA